MTLYERFVLYSQLLPEDRVTSVRFSDRNLGDEVLHRVHGGGPTIRSPPHGARDFVNFGPPHAVVPYMLTATRGSSATTYTRMMKGSAETRSELALLLVQRVAQLADDDQFQVKAKTVHANRPTYITPLHQQTPTSDAKELKRRRERRSAAHAVPPEESSDQEVPSELPSDSPRVSEEGVSGDKEKTVLALTKAIEEAHQVLLNLTDVQNTSEKAESSRVMDRGNSGREGGLSETETEGVA